MMKHTHTHTHTHTHSGSRLRGALGCCRCTCLHPPAPQPVRSEQRSGQLLVLAAPRFVTPPQGSSSFVKRLRVPGRYTFRAAPSDENASYSGSRPPRS
eukprot:1182216-Prorocentrum_minimum.AAC.4